MRKMLVLIPFVLLLAACGALATPTPPDSGITGQVLIGPVCPVVMEGQDCADKPYQATITVNSPDGRKIVQFQTDEQGKFNVPLAPGDYILHPESPKDAPLPFGAEQPFTVLPRQFTQLTVTYDSGIR